MAMTLKDTLAQLESLGDEKRRAHNKKSGAGDNQFGVPMGDIRKLAAKIKTNDKLASALWNTGNIDAQLLAILLIKPNTLSRDEMDRMVRSANFSGVADWLNSYVVKNHPDKETLRQAWMEDDDPWAARAGWSLTSERIAKSPDGLDVPALLDRIESEMGTCGAGSAMDDELVSCNNRYSLLQASQARHRYRREIGRLSRLSGLQGLHLSVRPDLDQRNGASAKLTNRQRLVAIA